MSLLSIRKIFHRTILVSASIVAGIAAFTTAGVVDAQAQNIVKRSVITDVYISGGVNPGPGYVPLSSNAIADPGSNAPAANLTEGIGGKNVWVYVKYEDYDPGDPKKPVPSRVLVDFNVGDWGGNWNFPGSIGRYGFVPPTTNGAGIPAGALSPGTRSKCKRIGMGVKWGTVEDLNRNPTATYVSRLALARTDNTSPPTWRFDPAMRGTPDVHLGCGDSIAFNIFYRVDEFANPPETPRSMTVANAAEVAQRFAPQLRFDRAAQGYPQDAQEYFAKRTSYSAHPINPSQWNAVPWPWYSSNENRSSLPKGTIPTYYNVYQVPNTSQLRITYWWFYGFQFPCLDDGISIGGHHHGDWEHIVVITNTAQNDIAAVRYAQHNGYYTRIAGPRDAPCTPGGTGRCEGDSGFKRVDGTHPVVYVGKYSHGSFHDSSPGVSGPGGCAYYGDARNPTGAADYWSVWTQSNLINLAGNAQQWISEDRAASFHRWGGADDAPATHPARESASEPLLSCKGVSLYAVENAGCYKSECLAGDDQASENCLRECKPGYSNTGLTCHKLGDDYGRLSSDYKYEYKYIIPTEDVGLTRRRTRSDVPQETYWALPAQP